MLFEFDIFFFTIFSSVYFNEVYKTHGNTRHEYSVVEILRTLFTVE